MATAKINGTKYELTGTGLDEGRQYAASIEYAPDDGAAGRNTGMSAQWVLAGGTVMFTQAVAFLTGNNRAAGTLKGWLRAPDSAFNGEAVGSVATIRVND
jgi:hypothetical protein